MKLFFSRTIFFFFSSCYWVSQYNLWRLTCIVAFSPQRSNMVKDLSVVPKPSWWWIDVLFFPVVGSCIWGSIVAAIQYGWQRIFSNRTWHHPRWKLSSYCGWLQLCAEKWWRSNTEVEGRTVAWVILNSPWQLQPRVCASDVLCFHVNTYIINSWWLFDLRWDYFLWQEHWRPCDMP